MKDSDSICPFCGVSPERLVASNDLAIAFWDRYPVNPGHLLVCPRRHVASFFALSEAEVAAAFRLIGEMKARCDADFEPAGYNVGINIGRTAGQTVMHVHIHLIPRYEGDVNDATGGVRHVIPGKANYLSHGCQACS